MTCPCPRVNSLAKFKKVLQKDFTPSLVSRYRRRASLCLWRNRICSSTSDPKCQRPTPFLKIETAFQSCMKSVLSMQRDARSHLARCPRNGLSPHHLSLAWHFPRSQYKEARRKERRTKKHSPDFVFQAILHENYQWQARESSSIQTLPRPHETVFSMSLKFGPSSFWDVSNSRSRSISHHCPSLPSVSCSASVRISFWIPSGKSSSLRSQHAKRRFRTQRTQQL